MAYSPYTRDESHSVIIGPMSNADTVSYDNKMNGPLDIGFKSFTDNTIKSGSNAFRVNAAASKGDFKALVVYFAGWQVQADEPRWPGITKRSTPLNVAYYPYVINWNGNGGTVKEKTTQVSFDKLPLNIGTYNVPTRGSWIFKGWSTSENGEVKYAYDFKTPSNSGKIVWKDFPTKTVGSATNPEPVIADDCVGDGTLNLYAIWQQPNCTITFKNYSANTPDGSVTMKYGDKYANVSIPKKTGYIFGGYFTKANGEGTKYYTDKGVITSGYVYYGDKGETTTTLTLHAKWTPITYKVKFSSDAGNKITIERTYTYDTSYTLPRASASGFAYLGYSFAYWANGKSKYNDGQNVKNLSSTNNGVVNFKAMWSPNTYSVSYRTNIGYVLDPDTTVAEMGLPILNQTTSTVPITFDTLFTIPKCTAKVPGLTFYCWLDTQTGRKYFAGNKYLFTSRLVGGVLVAQNFTLYPVFNLLPTVLTLTDGIIKKNATSYKFVSPTEITDSTIALYKINNSTQAETLFTNYTYSQVLLDGLYSVTITIPSPIGNKIAVYINGKRQVWHKGIFYTLTNINGNTYKWLPADTFTYSGEEFKRL